jgi:hypothetical protein
MSTNIIACGMNRFSWYETGRRWATSAIAIDDRGQILAKGCDQSRVFCYGEVRLDPIPAVAQAPSVTMLQAGLVLLGGLQRRQHLARPMRATNDTQLLR